MPQIIPAKNKNLYSFIIHYLTENCNEYATIIKIFCNLSLKILFRVNNKSDATITRLGSGCRGAELTDEFKKKLYLILTGVVTGAVNGFFGGGGGMIVVPLLTFLLKTETKKAHATAIAIILPISVVSAIVYFFKGSFDFSAGIPSGIGVVAGGIAGAWLLGKLSSKLITRIFAVVMLAAGIKLLFF